MNMAHFQTETRQVSGFEQVSIRGNTCSAQLFLTQSEQEELS